MDYFNELLQSYDKLKKRQFKVSFRSSGSLLIEAKLSVEAETKAKHYVQLAISKAVVDDYIVPIPELGSNARIFVSKTGKQAGKVVVDNVISRYPMAVADQSGNPMIKGGTWSQFVNKFNDQTEEQPQQQGMQPDMGMGMPQPEVSEMTLNLVDSAKIYTRLAQDNKFFTIPKSLTSQSPSWMQAGALGDFSEIERKIVGPEPFSVESKLNFAQTTQKDPNSEATLRVPLREQDKELVSKVFLGFAERINKIYTNEFTEEDAIWINHRVFNDRTGFWIKEPSLLPYGVSLSWRYSKSDLNKSFFKHLMTNYNEKYTNWAKEHNLEAKYPIVDTYADLSKKSNPYEFNSIRGSSAEHIKIAIHALLNKDYENAATILQQVNDEYGKELQLAYDSAMPYTEGLAGADASVLDYNQMVQELEKYAPGASVQETVLKILPKLAMFESESLLVRKPLSIDHVGTKVGNGFKADVRELYSSPEDIQDLLINRYRFTPEETQDFIQGDTLNVGLKTMLREGDVNIGESSVQALFTDLWANDKNPFIANTLTKFGLDGAKTKDMAQKVQKISQILNTVFADISVAGYDSESLKKHSMNTLMDKVKKSSEYDDLVYLADIENADIDDSYTKQKIQSLFERRMILGYFKKQVNLQKDGKLTPEATDWRRFLATSIYTAGGAIQNQLDEVRYFDTGRVYFLNHNKCIEDPLQGFVNGTINLDTTKYNTLSFYSPASKRKMLKVSLENYKKNEFQNYLTLDFYKNYVKTNSKRAVIYGGVKESVEYLIKSLQQIV